MAVKALLKIGKKEFSTLRNKCSLNPGVGENGFCKIKTYDISSLKTTFQPLINVVQLWYVCWNRVAHQVKEKEDGINKLYIFLKKIISL